MNLRKLSLIRSTTVLLAALFLVIAAFLNAEALARKLLFFGAALCFLICAVCIFLSMGNQKEKE